jgi:hypothetical protein
MMPRIYLPPPDDLWPYPRCDHGCIQGDCPHAECLYHGDEEYESSWQGETVEAVR